MEEERKGSPADEYAEESMEITEATETTKPAEATEAAETAETAEAALEPVDGAAVTAEAAEEISEAADSEVRPPLTWSFGENAPAPAAAPQKTKHFTFTAAFASVIALCLALLAVTLFLGENGFKVIRTIFTERTIFVREYDSESGLLTPEEAADAVRPSTVTVVVRKDGGTGIGSGFIYTADGYICTNHHVIEGAISQQVVLSTGETVDAVIVGGNADADVAVLKIEKEGLIPVKLGSSDDLLTGEAVMAVGTPAKLEYAGTATFGRVSYPKRLLSLTDSSNVVYKKMTLIQTDTVVNHGNSGGPLCDMYGRVVGIVVMKLGNLNGIAYDGIGFAIPIDGAKIIIDAIIKTGSFEGENPIAEGRTVLGLSGRGLVAGMWYDDPAAENIESSMVERPGYFYMPCDGVYVMSVTGANAVNRLKKGDIITKINGLNMYTVYDVIDAVNRHYAGETVTLTIMRLVDEDYVQLTVELVLSVE